MSDVDMEDIERRLQFVMDELKVIGNAAHNIVRKAKPAGLADGATRWSEGRFSAFLQVARDNVWTARCTAGLVPPQEETEQ